MKNWFHGDGRYLNRIPLPCRPPEGDEGGGGGGGDDDKDKKKKKSKGREADDEDDDDEDLDDDDEKPVTQKQFRLLMKSLSKKKSKARDDDEDDEVDEDDDEDLSSKAKKARAATDKTVNDQKATESVLRFSIALPQWMKDNSALLPKDVPDLLVQAEKEKYENAFEKDAAIKSGIVQSFFSVQANLDLLTPALKSTIEDYLKLTKNGKQEKARHIFETIFEPTLETLRLVKKAATLSKGHGDGGDDAYKKKLMSGSRKHHLGEKQ